MAKKGPGPQSSPPKPGFIMVYQQCYSNFWTTYIFLETKLTPILEDLTHQMEGQPPKKEVIWVLDYHIRNLGRFIIYMKSAYKYIYIYSIYTYK